MMLAVALAFSVPGAAAQNAVASETFVLPDGSGGAIERVGARYRMVFDQLPQPVALDGVSNATFRSAQLIEDSTLVVLQTATPQCAVRLLLLAVRDRNVQTWPLGDCRTLPRTSIERQQASFDTVEAGVSMRYRFSKGSLGQGEPIAARADGVALATSAAMAGAAPPAPSSSTTAPRTPARAPAQGYVAPTKPVFKRRDAVPATISIPAG